MQQKIFKVRAVKLGKANGDFHGDTQIEFEEKDRQAPEKEEPRKDEEVQEKVRNRKVEEIVLFYSYLSASTGGSPAACRAGRKPETAPTVKEKRSA